MERVLKTSLPPSGVMDGLVSQFDMCGNYTVKSGYKRASSLVFNHELEVEGRGNLLLGVESPTEG